MNMCVCDVVCSKMMTLKYVILFIGIIWYNGYYVNGTRYLHLTLFNNYFLVFSLNTFFNCRHVIVIIIICFKK